ncbi:threonine aldolase family protein [Hamadaea tsunoensis]|uniref:threonine aldolase family protein n=1 Tax=Hamadaea tsunoensis TaxID=53368 RepID=UPI0003FB0642|nr:beta-eliminating lyase-related protein [Hamadaea tsunoensis]
MADDAQRAHNALRSCTRILSGKHPETMAEQLAALAGAGVDLDRRQDVYGDGIVAELEARVAGLLGKPAAAYFPTGTMAQQIALRLWAERAAEPTVALHPLHHTEVHERKAYAQLSGLRAVWPTGEPRQPTADEIRAVPDRFSVLAVELPLREPGFVLPTFDELDAVTRAARDRGAYVHFDGARLWESTTHLGQELPVVAELADSVYVSFYKSLGGLSGAALAGPADFVAAAKAWRHRHGGQLFTQWPAVLSALAGLDRELPRLPAYVAHAKVVAAALAQLPGAVVTPNPPHTHQFQLWLPYAPDALREANLQMSEQDGVSFVSRWSAQPPGDRSMAEVTIAGPALEWTADEVVDAGLALIDRAKSLT